MSLRIVHQYIRYICNSYCTYILVKHTKSMRTWNFNCIFDYDVFMNYWIKYFSRIIMRNLHYQGYIIINVHIYTKFKSYWTWQMRQYIVCAALYVHSSETACMHWWQRLDHLCSNLDMVHTLSIRQVVIEFASVNNYSVFRWMVSNRNRTHVISEGR